jgi:hypothetical protein
LILNSKSGYNDKYFYFTNNKKDERFDQTIKFIDQ